VKGKQYLNVNDLVTFGHLGGHEIAAGELAPKQPAEFQFVVSFACNVYDDDTRDFFVQQSFSCNHVKSRCNKTCKNSGIK